MDLIESKKESALVKAGATREEAYKTIVKGLPSKKMTIDKFGDEHYEEDTASQLRSAELISRLNGDLKTETVIDNRKATVNVFGVSSELIKELIVMASDVRGQLESLKSSGRQTGEIIDVTAR